MLKNTQIFIWSIALIIGSFVLFLGISPRTFWKNPISEVTPPHTEERLQNGKYLYNISGCAACHNNTAPGTQELAGGRRLKTPFGTLLTPNITPSKDFGIGGWSDQEFIDAMTIGLSPEGKHYLAAFPFTSYKHMPHQDLIDLKYYIDTAIPAANTLIEKRELTFPFNIRIAQGFWKWLYLDRTPTYAATALEKKELKRGAYLTESLGHCGECHTPRSILGGLDNKRWLAGVPVGGTFPSAPNITPHQDGIGTWSKEQTRHALKTGILPNGKKMGGEMDHVIKEITSNLNDTDLEAMAEYLHHIEALPNGK